jgi:hypothetical protein
MGESVREVGEAAVRGVSWTFLEDENEASDYAPKGLFSAM